MSVSTEVQRTLVKSPPELWSELGNPDSLARHLAELGEIRITAVEPEAKVEWEAEGATGVVHLKQSGWGTKVILSVTRNPPAAEEASRPEAEPEAEPVAVAVAVAAVEPALVELESEPIPEPIAAIELEPEPVAAVEPDQEQATSEPAPIADPEPELGFFARLFRKRQAKPIATVEPGPEPIAAAEPAVEPDPEPACLSPAMGGPRTGEIVAMAAPEPIYRAPPAEAAPDLAAELASVEVQMAEETTELLTGVLDRLGAAHHRPFSRG